MEWTPNNNLTPWFKKYQNLNPPICVEPAYPTNTWLLRAGARNIRGEAVSDPACRLMYGVPRQMRIARGRLNLAMAEQLFYPSRLPLRTGGQRLSRLPGQSRRYPARGRQRQRTAGARRDAQRRHPMVNVRQNPVLD